MNLLFKKIAEENNTTEAEVKAELENTIAEIYENPNELALKIPCKGKIPTADEFIDFVVKQIPLR